LPPPPPVAANAMEPSHAPAAQDAYALSSEDTAGAAAESRGDSSGDSSPKSAHASKPCTASHPTLPPPVCGPMSWAAKAAAAAKGPTGPPPTSAAAKIGFPPPARKLPIAPTSKVGGAEAASPTAPPAPSEVSNTAGESSTPAAASQSPTEGAAAALAAASAAARLAKPAEASKPPPVTLWVSGLPTEESRGRDYRENPVRPQEIKDVLNAALRDHATHLVGQVTEVDWKDERKPFAFAMLSDERTAKELVVMSKQKKVNLRGDRLILDLSNYNTARVETLYAGGPSVSRGGGSQWQDRHEDRAERDGDRGRGSGERCGKGKGGKGKGKSESGWNSDDRGGRSWASGRWGS